MTSLSWSLAGKKSVLSLLSEYLRTFIRTKKLVMARAKTLFVVMFRALLTISALTCFTVAAFNASIVLGWAVLGICLLVFEWAVKK